MDALSRLLDLDSLLQLQGLVVNRQQDFLYPLRMVDFPDFAFSSLALCNEADVV